MLIWKFIHVLGVVLMVGNVIVTGLWALWAMQTRNQAVAVFASQSIIRADWVLTFLGGAMITIAGIMLVQAHQLDWWQTRWLREGILATGLSTAVWMVALIPDQARMQRLSTAGDVGALRKIFLRWSVLGWGATVLLLWALWVMITQPL